MHAAEDAVMSAARLLLDSMLAAQGPWVADDRGVIVLTVGNDVIVNVIEDETAEEIHIFSAAGYLHGSSAMRVELAPELAGEGYFSVRLVRPSGLVVPHRTLARAQLDGVSFCKELSCHVSATRALADALRKDCAQPHRDPDATGERSTWHSWHECVIATAQGEPLTLSLPAR